MTTGHHPHTEKPSAASGGFSSLKFKNDHQNVTSAPSLEFKNDPRNVTSEHINRYIDAETDGKNQDTWLRVVFAKKMRSLFAWLNFGVYALVGIMAVSDTILIVKGIISPEQRLMNEKIIMALIGGTVVQSGAAFLIMMKYLFPATPHHNHLVYEAAKRNKKNDVQYAVANNSNDRSNNKPTKLFQEDSIAWKGILILTAVISVTIGIFFGSVIWMPAKALAAPVKDLTSTSTAAPLSASMPIASSSPAVTSPAPCTGQPIDINITQSVDMASGKPVTRHVGKPSHIAPVSQCASTSANR